MARHVRTPESTRLELTQGDWLLVKKRLNSGENKKIYVNMIKVMSSEGTSELDPFHVGSSQAAYYLLDWGTFTDSNGHPLVIRNKTPDAIEKILHELDQEDYNEVVNAVQVHVTQMTEERELVKNAQDGVTKSSAISPLPSDVTGVTSGSQN